MEIAGGDWRFFFPENISNFIGIPSAWDASLNTGIGQPQLNTLWITGYLYFTSLLSKAGLSWNIIGLVFWLIPPFIIGFISTYLLFNNLFKKNRSYAIISGFIYISNTYFLMIFSGGQLGVALSYSIAPLVILRLIKNIKSPSLYNSIFFGLVTAIQIMFDPRIFIVTCILLFGCLFIYKPKNIVVSYVYIIVLPLLIIGLIHSYWVIPISIYYLGSKVVPGIYSKANDFSFFSFAKLENSISLLHPNWPENIFGRVHFMRPEFLVLPFIAFIPLVSKKNKEIKSIVILSVIALICAFLAKGSNDPFGIIYELLLKYVPGFTVFRDPTKFYIPIAICFSLLIPLGLEKVAAKISGFNRFKKNNLRITITMFVLFWMVLLLPLLQGKVKGVIELKKLPQEYSEYKDYIANQPEYFRTLWIPQIQRFGYFSNNHPAIGRGEIFYDSSLNGILKQLQSAEFEKMLSDLSVKYVVVPYDPYGEIFVDDGKFDAKKYNVVINKIEKIPYLSKEKSIGKIVMFRTKTYQPHFRFVNSDTFNRVRIFEKKPYYYKLNIECQGKETLIFGDRYDKNWVLKTSNNILRSKPYGGLNSFELTCGGSYNIEIMFVPQEQTAGLFYVSVSVIAFLTLYLLLRLKKPNND